MKEPTLLRIASRMMIVAWALLFIAVAPSSLLSEEFPVKIRTERENAGIIQQYLEARKWLDCDCAAPTPSCELPCKPKKRRGWICGTPMMQADAEIDSLIESGAPSSVVVSKIERHPSPFTPIAILRNYKEPK
ncbi:MAG: hypothetical protein OXQ30_05445 [Boseongicola sp.]|nr:hypothetical protein [Boseongicola sp.]